MTVNIPSSSKIKTYENTVIEYVEDDVYEIPDSDVSKSAIRVFDKIDNGNFVFLPLSKFVNLIKTLVEVFHSE